MKITGFTQWKRVEPLIAKGVEFHGKHWKKFGLGGIAMGSAIGFYKTSTRDDNYFEFKTPCEKKVKIFENMYLDGMMGGVTCAFPGMTFCAFAAAGTIGLGCVVLASPMIVANKFCQDHKQK